VETPLDVTLSLILTSPSLTWPRTEKQSLLAYAWRQWAEEEGINGQSFKGQRKKASARVGRNDEGRPDAAFRKKLGRGSVVILPPLP
jgi:hypothetical protein